MQLCINNKCVLSKSTEKVCVVCVHVLLIYINILSDQAHFTQKEILIFTLLRKTEMTKTDHAPSNFYTLPSSFLSNHKISKICL